MADFNPSMVREKMRLRIVYNRGGCIGSGHCLLSDPYNFGFDENDYKAELKEGSESGAKGVWIKDIETDDPHLVINAAKTCTPKVIAIIDLKTNRRIAP